MPLDYALCHWMERLAPGVLDSLVRQVLVEDLIPSFRNT